MYNELKKSAAAIMAKDAASVGVNRTVEAFLALADDNPAIVKNVVRVLVKIYQSDLDDFYKSGYVEDPVDHFNPMNWVGQRCGEIPMCVFKSFISNDEIKAAHEVFKLYLSQKEDMASMKSTASSYKKSSYRDMQAQMLKEHSSLEAFGGYHSQYAIENGLTPEEFEDIRRRAEML